MTILSYNQRRRPPLDAVVAAVLAISVILVVSSKTSSSCCVAFVTTYCPRQVRMFDYYNSNRLQYRPLFMARGPTNNNDGNDDNENEYFNEIPSDTSFDTNNNPHKQSNQITTTTTTTIRNDTIPLTDLRLTKARLEHQHTRQFVTKQPLKLPYAVSQKWIQHHFSITTKEEFEQLVSDGDIKNVYISKRPEEYYGRRGEWISWDHYLLGSCGEEDGYRNNGKNGTAVSLLKWQ